MMQKEGTVMPTVAAAAPVRPPCLKPTKVAQLIAIGPGVDSAITARFIISSWVIHFFFSTHISSISGIMAYPPPNVKSPILANVRKSSSMSSGDRGRFSFILFIHFQ